MGLIYITGISGSGKSAVREELRKRGYETHEGDDNLCAFYHNDTGLMVDRPRSSADRTPEWRAQHTWKMSKDKLLKLKEDSANKLVFVCGVAANEDEYLDVFDKVYALVLDLPTMKHRIKTRTDNDFGKSKHEMDTLIRWQHDTERYYREVGARIIDATKPLSKVVDELLSSLK